MERLIPLLGLAVFVGIAWLLSENRKAFPTRIILWGMGLQIIFAILILGIPALGVPGVFAFVFEFLNTSISKLLSFSDMGAKFLFADLMDYKHGYVFAFRALPTILFFSALVSILYYLGILQKLVSIMARVMQKTMGTSGAESLSASANIFVGQTEAPLMVKPFVKTITRSEIMTVMTAGMATIAGGVMAAFVGLLQDAVPDIGGHLVTASVMSAPAAIAIAKIMVPEEEVPKTMGTSTLDVKVEETNIVEAAAKGTSEGLGLALNVGAMLIVFIALIAMVNFGFSHVGTWFGMDAGALTLESILGFCFKPIAWLMGVDTQDITRVGAWLGEKVVINEFVAYVHLGEAKELLTERSLIITSYALCGFANFSSIGIQLGGIGAMAPNQRPVLAKLGFKAMIAGNLAAFMTASVVALLI